MQPNAARSAGPGGRTGTIRIDVTDYERPAAIREDAPDNAIIAVAWHLTQQGVRAVFVTKDLSARIKSDSLGIKTEDFENQRVDADRLYTGFVTADVEGALIDVPAHRRAKRGRKPLDPALPREVLRHELPDHERVCPHDGARLSQIGVEVSEQLDIVPQQVRVIRHERVKYACPCCDGGLRLAAKPPLLKPQV
jgi:predicted ribonuclease YlaK